MMDDPRHQRVRRLVSMGLTPQAVQRLEHELRRRTRVLLDQVEDGVAVDFLTDVAVELPMQTICILLGVPEEDRHELFECVEHVFDFREGRASFDTTEAGAAAQTWMFDYGADLIAERRRQPGDDMLSVAVHATLPEVDPPTLTDDELFAFFMLLFSAGSETTRNAIAGGVLALIENPAQLDALRADPDLPPGALEEIFRWTTPSPSKRRTATCETELGGHNVAPGDKVVIWEGSANRDELVFDRPMDFDIRRDPNPHLAFGRGVHHCLGANLARLETRVILEELLSRFAS